MVAATAAAVLTCCSSNAPGRPTTDATIEIVAPAPNAVVGPHVQLAMQLVGARLVSPALTGGAINGNEGHIHLLLDGQLIAMPYRLDIDLGNLTRGTHTVEAEFVASDHLPFANRPVAAVTFAVR